MAKVKTLKKVDLSQYEKKIIPIIKKYNGEIHSSDIALETEFPMVHIKFTLNKLANKYLAEIIVDDNGELTYKFPKKMKIKKKKESSISIIKYLLIYSFIMLKFVMKFAIMAMLITYGFLAVAILIIFVVIVYISNESDRGRDGRDTRYDDPYYEPGRKEQDNRDLFAEIFSIFDFVDNSDTKPFYLQTFSFIFGDKQNIDNFDNERNILLFIRKHKRVTLSDVVNLSGLNEEDAQSMILDITTKYDGEIKVSNKGGIIYYEFNEIHFQKKRVEGTKNYSYIWERKLKTPLYNLNPPSTNFKIVVLNLMILMFSAVFTFTDFSEIDFIGQLYGNHLFTTWFGYIPLVYSTLFFLIPTLRTPSINKKREDVKFKNDFYFLLNEFSYNIKNHFVPSEHTDDIVERFLNKRYPTLMKKDFHRGKDVINLTRYHREIYFSAKGDIKNIKILDPEDVEFENF